VGELDVGRAVTWFPFPYSISEWYLLRHEPARGKQENPALQIHIPAVKYSVGIFDLTHPYLLVMINFLGENFK
jgi:hypothetical protein